MITSAPFHGCFKAGVTALGPPSDNFNRADSAVSLGTSTSGHTWVALTGTWGISSNKGYVENSSGSETIAYIEANDADVTIEVTLNNNTGSNSLNRMGIAFRVSDSSNYLFAFFTGTNILRMVKVVAGSATTIISATVTFANNSVLRVVLSGDQISVYQNAVLKIGPVTEAHNQTATKHGIMWQNGGRPITECRWEDFAITL